MAIKLYYWLLACFLFYLVAVLQLKKTEIPMNGQTLINIPKIVIPEIDMSGKIKKELIEENYDLEKRKNNTTAAEGRNISQAGRAYIQAAQWFEKNVAEEEKKKATCAQRLSIFFGTLAFMSAGYGRQETRVCPLT